MAQVKSLPQLDWFSAAVWTGEGYEAVVPDTLDLAERCRLGLRGVAGQTDPECYYQMWFRAVWASATPYLEHIGSDPVCTPKFAESFPLVRTACGSSEYLDYETYQMAHLLANISADDGLYYCVWKPDRPWHSNYMSHAYDAQPEDFCQVAGAARMMRAMMSWRERDGDERWDKYLRAMARGLAKIAVYKDDYAYYPDGGHSIQYAYPRSGWLHTKEPQSDIESGEGSVLDSLGHVIYALSRWYMVSQDAEALELARKLTNFALLPKMWGGLAEEVGVHGGEQGHFHSHPHGHMVGLRGILEYGWAANDARALEFVRRSYEHLRTRMIPRIGWFPDNGIGDGLALAEACNLGDLVALGIRLSDLRLGDYWEDVDAVTRNLLPEQQLTPEKIEHIMATFPARKRSRPGVGQDFDNMPQRITGIFASFASGNSLPATPIMGCCTANATQGLYFAWEGTVRCDGDHAQVNLLLNRASRLVDVDSYLPYEGKVAIHNKAARRVSVRILSWIDRNRLTVTVDGQERQKVWVGNYLLVAGLHEGDEIVLEFPITESSCTYTAHHRVWRKEKKFTYTFRGSTVVDVEPKETSRQNIPIYQRGYLCKGPAPMKKVMRFVPDKVIRNW